MLAELTCGVSLPRALRTGQPPSIGAGADCCDGGRSPAPKGGSELMPSSNTDSRAAALTRALATDFRFVAGVACVLVTLLVSSTDASPADAMAFGRDVAGTAWFEMGSDYKRSSRFTIDRALTVTALVAYLDGLGSGTGSQQVRFALYADSAGEPGALVAQSGVGTIADGAPPAWVRLPLTSALALAPGAYHLAILSGATARVA